MDTPEDSSIIVLSSTNGFFSEVCELIPYMQKTTFNKINLQ